MFKKREEKCIYTYVCWSLFKFLSVILLEIWLPHGVSYVDCMLVGPDALVVRQMVPTLSTLKMQIAHSFETLVATNHITRHQKKKRQYSAMLQLLVANLEVFTRK